MSYYLERAADSMNAMFPTLPWSVGLSLNGQSASFGTGPQKAEIACKKEGPLRELAGLRLSRFLDRYVEGECEFKGDIYSIVGVKNHLKRDADWKVGLFRSVQYVGSRIFPSSVRRKLVSVSSHYDLPNEFIESYLDTRTKAYSCAMWKDPDNISEPDDESLEDAQHRKFFNAAKELEIQETDKFLDIGCGYGYQVNLAETEFGCKNALGITLSQNQVENGFSKNIKRIHYLDLPTDASYDKIYTCGMVSHLDRSELTRYYKQVYGLLKSGGRFWMHGIIPRRNDYGMDNYNSLSGTFSQKYIFPDHYQFPLDMHLQAMEELGFRIRKVYYRYGHYAKTLRHWYRRYLETLPQTRHLITPTIERAWHLYLTFASVIDGQGANEAIIKQILAEKP
ncbi:MAG: hypothetical protein COB53_09630 [Elusimicrobia bacterium]|nr:MAG: hypothetical protein COB53_09630 [Elusimicrobiota bacterium]